MLIDQGQPIPTEDTVDIILLVWGGGGDLGLPDPDESQLRRGIEQWCNSERAEVIRYAAAVHAVASDNHDIDVPEKPQRLIELMDAIDCQFA